MIYVAALAAVAAAAALLSRAFTRRRKVVGQALIVSPPEHTRIDPSTGAVTSIQCADLVLPKEALEAIWSPMHLERLARTYWRFLSRVTLHTIQIKYREDGRDVTLLGLVPLLTFHAPEYEMDGERGIVRWRIEKGFLVADEGRNGRGYLEIDVQRRPYDKPGHAIAHVEVEVANFYPTIMHKLSRWVYENTQSRIHVLVTHGFLRSLARLDLDESRVGRFAKIEDLPDPVPARERDDLGNPVASG